MNKGTTKLFPNNKIKTHLNDAVVWRIYYGYSDKPIRRKGIIMLYFPRTKQEQEDCIIGKINLVDGGSTFPVRSIVLELYKDYEFDYDEFNEFIFDLRFIDEKEDRLYAIEEFKKNHRLKKNPIVRVTKPRTPEVRNFNRNDKATVKSYQMTNPLKESIVDGVANIIGDTRKELSEVIVDSVTSSVDKEFVTKKIVDTLKDIPITDTFKGAVGAFYNGSSEQKETFIRNLNTSMKKFINSMSSSSSADSENIVEDVVADVINVYPNADLPDDLVVNDIDYSMKKSTSSVPNETILIEEKPITKNEPIIINSKTGSIPIEGKASSKEYREIDEKTNKKDKKTTSGGTVMHQEKNKKGKKDKKQDEKKTVNQNNEEVATIEPSHQMVNILNSSDPRYLTQIIETYCVNPRVFDSAVFTNSCIEQYKQAIPIVIGGALLSGIENGTIPNLYSQGYRLIINPIGSDPNNIYEIRIVALKSHDTTMTEHPELFEIIISNPFDFYNYEANTFINGVYQHNMKSRMYEEETK